MNNPLHERLSEYLDGVGGAMAQAALKAHLDAHPDEMGEALEYARDAACLRLILDPARQTLPDLVRHALEFDVSGKTFTETVCHALAADDEAAKAAVRTHPSSRDRWSRAAVSVRGDRKRGKAWWLRKSVIIPLAAAVAIVLTLHGVSSYRAERSVAGHVLAAKGEVNLITQGQFVELHVADTICCCASIQIGADGFLRYAYADGSVIELEKNTRLKMEHGQSGWLSQNRSKKIRLEQGALLARVTQQPRDYPLSICTPHAEAIVVGTEFKIGVQENKTRLEVQGGVVRFQGLREATAVNVAAGNFAEMQEGQPMASGLITAAPADVSDGLVGYWKFDEGRGDILGDASCYSNASARKAGTSWSRGRSGAALEFNGVGGFVDVGNSSALNPEKALTLAVWINPAKTIAARSGEILSKNDMEEGRDPTGLQYFLRVQGQSQTVRFGIADVRLTGRAKIMPDTWSHIAATYDGTQMKIYVVATMS